MKSLRVEKLSLFPIKSCGLLAVSSFQVGLAGPEIQAKDFWLGDRQWMFVDSDGKYLSQRSHPKLALFQPRMDKDKFKLKISNEEFEIQAATGERKTVSVWGQSIDAIVGDPRIAEAASELLKTQVQFVSYDERSEREALIKGRGLGVQTRFTDTQPFLISSAESLADLNSRLEIPIGEERFRSNIFLSGAGLPFAEDEWKFVGNPSIVFEATKPCARCKIITVNPKTGIIDNSEPLKVLAQFRRQETQVYFGQYFLSRSFGETLSVGDLLQAV